MSSEQTKRSPLLYAPKKSVIPLKKYTTREIPKVKETSLLLLKKSQPVFNFN
jgi:hypothetical protein